MPKSNTDFWRNKLQGNIERDGKVLAAFATQGWKCIVVWECEKDNPKLISRLCGKIRGNLST